MVGKQRERMAELLGGFRRLLLRQVREAGAVVRVHRELAGVELRRPGFEFSRELAMGFVGIAAREPDQAEQPVQPLGGITLLSIGLTILNDGSLAEHGLGAIEVAAGDVNHRGFEVDERELGIEIDRARQCLQPLLAPRRVGQPELVAPVAGLERDRAARGRERLGGAPGAHEEERQRRVRFCEIAIQFNRTANVIDGTRQERAVGLIPRPRHLVLPEPRIREPHVGDGVLRIARDRPLEALDCRRNA